MQDRFSFLKNKINEAISEISSDYETFDDYKKSVGKSKCFVYSAVDSHSIPTICRNGADGAKEFVDVNHMCFGRGIYTTMDYNWLKRYGEGDAVIKYAVKSGAFDNFLIFDMGIRRHLYETGALTNHERFSTTVKRLFGEDGYRIIESRVGDLSRFDDLIFNTKYNSESNYLQRKFYDAVTMGEGYIELQPGRRYASEKMLDMSNVDGWIYYSNLYGPVAIFRTTDILIPHSYTYKIGGKHGVVPPESDFKYCFNNSKDFDEVNNTIDSFRRSRGGYPDTKYYEKTVRGFALVRRGKKYNLINAKTGKYLSPLDFDTCSAIDPITGEATFTIKYEGETLVFTLHSPKYGEEFEILLQMFDENGEPLDSETLDYDNFLSVMQEVANSKGKLNESVEEVYTHKDFNMFKKSISDSKNVFLYRASNPQVAKSEYENGPNYEYTGTGGDDSLYYGFGVYTVRDLNSILSGKYGSGVCKFVLKDGYKDFIILDDDLRSKYDSGATVYDELVRLVPEDILKKMDNDLKHLSIPLNNYEQRRAITSRGIEAYKNTSISPMVIGGKNTFNTASFARALKLVLQGHKLHDELARNAYSELLMAKTRIRGFVYNGRSDGECVLVRDFNSLMPVAYSADAGHTWKTDDENEDRFNKINRKVHPWYQYRGEYENIGLRDKPVGNFSLVSGRQGYNFKDIWFHRPLLPIDADNATNFDPISNMATFNIAGIEFQVEVDDDMNATLFATDDGDVQELPYDDFMQFIEGAKEMGAIRQDKKMYTNCLLNPNNKRNK